MTNISQGGTAPNGGCQSSVERIGLRLAARCGDLEALIQAALSDPQPAHFLREHAKELGVDLSTVEQPHQWYTTQTEAAYTNLARALNETGAR